MTGRWLRLAPALVGLIAFVAWTAWTSVVTVGVGEVVVVRRFGAFLREPWKPGLHLGLPWGLEARDRIRLDEVRTIEIGLAGPQGVDDAPDLGEYLAGDENLLRCRAVLQFRVADPSDFFRESDRPLDLLERLAESSLTRSVSRRSADDLLRADRIAAAREAESELGRDVARLRLGVEVLSLNLVESRPPAEVAEDFHAAQAAGSEKERLARDAEGLAERTRIAAEAAATGRRDAATAEAARTVASARASTQRFLSYLPQLQADRPGVIRRIYSDALRDVLPKVRRKVVTTHGEPVDLGLIRGN